MWALLSDDSNDGHPVRLAYQIATLFSQNKLAISKQPAILFSQNKSTPATSQMNRLSLRGATYAQTVEGCKLNDVDSLWVSSTWFCGWGLKLRQRYMRVTKWTFSFNKSSR
jgi:hypothetical protein